MVNREEMQQVIRDETQKAVKAAIVGAAEMERRKRKKARRKKMFKFLGKCIKLGCLVGAGYMIGVHRDVIIKRLKKVKWIKKYKVIERLGKCTCPCRK